MIHKLKTIQPILNDMLSGKKTFDVRKDDRNFQVGDRLDLFEGTDEITIDTDISQRKHGHFWIKYILRGGQFGIQEGYCVLGLTDDEF